MKWLYLISRNSESLNSVDELLKKKKAECVSIYIDDLPKDAISNEMVCALQEAQYVIFNLEKSFETNINFVFALGYVIGKKLTSFINSKQEFDSSLIFYSDIEFLKKNLKKNLSEYVAIDEKNKALSLLFKKGIPYTPDCFSFEISKNSLDNVKTFVKAGMDVNVRDSAGTPMLCCATRSNRYEIVKWLLDKGADIDAVSCDRGYSAVMDAVWKSDVKMTQLLLDKGANVNFVSNDGQTALIIATGSGNEEICKLLVEHGADIKFKDHMGMSSLDYASLFKKERLINLYNEYLK